MFWMESVLHRTRNGMCLLVGTHCGQVNGAVEIVKELFESVQGRYGSRVCGYMAVDSVDNIGLDQLKTMILKCARHQV